MLGNRTVLVMALIGCAAVFAGCERGSGTKAAPTGTSADSPATTEAPTVEMLLDAETVSVDVAMDIAKLDLDDAIARLERAESISTRHVGRTQVLDEQAIAFERILRSPDAARTFDRLLASDRAPTRLYGLCGISLTAPERFDPLLRECERSTEVVTFVHGCFIQDVPVRQVLHANHPHNLDIARGGLPQDLAGPTFR